MQGMAHVNIEHEIISAGVDWISATAKTPANVHASDQLSEHALERALDRGATIKPESRFGYVGYSTDGFFHGHSGRGRMTVASGAQADDLWSSIHNVSDHVSRLDLQVTIWTHGEQPHLGVQAYQRLRHNPPAKIKVKNVTLITAQPQGETCNVGKRVSENYGRIYDKAAESELGCPRTVWRYEVEYKNDLARRIGAHLHRSASRAGEVAALVRRWFLDRGVEPVFSDLAVSSALELPSSSHRRDTLNWFRVTLSKTVAKQISLHGRETVLQALGLLPDVNPN